METIILKMKSNSFQFQPARRIEIPKPKGGLRLLSIAGPRDKIVQEAIRIILECIYDCIFSEDSHGFRPNRGCHSAFLHISRKFPVARWAINADLVKFFDNVNHKQIINFLQERINDKKFIDLI